MTDHPLARPVTRILNEGRRPQLDWEGLRDAVEEARAWTAVLEDRFRGGFPLLVASEGAQALRPPCDEALAAQGAWLDRLSTAIEHQDPEALAGGLADLEAAAGRLAELLTTLRRLQAELPQFSDIPLVNEVLTLGLHLLKGKGDVTGELMARLPRLREFLSYLEGVRTGFAARHPGEPELDQAFRGGLDSLRQAAGGLFLYLQETRDPVDLSNSMTLFDRGIKTVAACFQAMRELEYGTLEYSEDPHLDRLAKAVEALLRGAGTRGEVDLHLAGVVRFQRNLAADLAVLGEQAFMPASLRRDFVPRMIDLLDLMDGELATLHQAGAAPPVLWEAVRRFQALGEEYDRMQGELEEHLARRPDLAESGHWDELVALMQGAYEGSVPDSRLEARIPVLLSLQEALRRRLALESHRQPGEAGTLEAVLEALDAQRGALDTLGEYLEGGDRELLLVAYEQLLPPTLRLLEFKREASAREAASQTSTVLCPWCGTANEPGNARCGRCTRPLPSVALGVTRPSEVLDLYDSRAPGSQSRALAENFQYLLDVCEDAISGVLTPEEARDLLLPFWETVLAAELRAQDTVRPTVAAVGDATLSSYQEELQALLAYLKEILTTLFEALDAHNLGGLSGLRAEFVEVAEGLQRFHQEVEEAAGTS